MSNSSLEADVAEWLDRHGITYTREQRVWFRRVDFLLSDGTIIQVQGCHWHGCRKCTKKPMNLKQRRSRGRDDAFRTYCTGKGLRLIEVWEHDMKRGDLTALEVGTAHLREPGASARGRRRRLARKGK